MQSAERKQKCAKEWHWTPILYYSQKINLKWIKDLRKTWHVKLLEENIEKRLLDIGLGNNFFGYDTKIISNKSKNKQVGLHQTKKVLHRTSLVAQWLRIRLPMQGTWVRALVREHPTCRAATKPMRHNYWAHAPQLLSPRAATTEACAPRARALQREVTAMRSPRTATKSSPCWPQLEKACAQRRPNAAKNKQTNK